MASDATPRPPDYPRLPVPPGAPVLAIATVATSLVLQAPVMWDVWRASGADLTFASAADGFERRLSPWGRHLEIAMSRSLPGLRRPTVWRDARNLLGRSWSFVQLQSPVAGAVGRIVAPRRRSYPLVYVAHGFHFHRDGEFVPNLVYRVVEETLAARADAIFVVAGEDFDAALAGPIGRRTRVYRLPGAGIDVDRFGSATPRRVFDDHADGAVVALFCGELIPRKDPMAAVAAVLRARERGRDVRLVIAGDGPLRGEVERVAARSDGATWLRHLPFSDEMPALMKGADVLISTSSQEGLPRVIVEAMAAGLPTISVTNRGSRELLADGTGRLVPQRDPHALGDALTSFDRSAFPSVSEMRGAAEAYSHTRVAEAYVNALGEVLA